MQLTKMALLVKPEVAQALAQGLPVVALESTIVSHGERRQPAQQRHSQRS